MVETVLIVPGIYNSDARHWQTLWEAGNPSFRRVQMDDWECPERAAWVASIEQAVRAVRQPVILVAHSLGCLAVAHWAQQGQADAVRGALLVAVPDPQGPNFPSQVSGFTPLPAQVLPFPSIIVSSTDDPYGSPAHARRCAERWGSTVVDIGAAGHINGDSNLGTWAEGKRLLDTLC